MKQYARACQLPKQPVVVAPDDIEMWKSKKILVGDRLIDRQVMGFPPDNPKVWLACPDDTNPYPGIKENKIMPNKDQYPFIPCCFSTNHMDPFICPNSKYNQYMRGFGRGNQQRQNQKLVTKSKEKRSSMLVDLVRSQFRFENYYPDIRTMLSVWVAGVSHQV